MSIIIQTGHHTSHSAKLMQMLYERGLGEPLKSHTYNLTADEVTEKLAKILDKKQSIVNVKVMDNLMIDLLLANLEQDDWGWASEYNIDTLSYWQEVDNNTRFILVFDSPKLLLKTLLDQTITTESLEMALQQWLTYHQKLLDFFESSERNCLLIEGELAINNLMNIKDHIQAITTNLKLKSDWQVQVSETNEVVDDNPMFDIVTDEILAQYPACMVLYETLIKKSSIRFTSKKLPTKNTLLGLIHSLNMFNEQQILQKKLLTENNNLQNQLITLMSEKQSLEQQLSQNVLLLEQSKNSVNAEQKAQIERSEQENKLLISQLHQVQEELEKYYLQHQKTTEQLKSIEQQKQQLQAQADAKAKLESELNTLKDAKQKAEQLANEQKSKLQAETDAKKKLESEIANLKEVKQKSDNLVKEKQKLESELASLKEAKQKAEQQAKASNNAKQENDLLISQLHQVQEELERYYLENQKLKAEQTKEPPKPVYYGAADRVKEDLPYRLGATMVSHSKSAKDLAVLPLALAKEYREFNKNKPSDELPAIEEYQDAQEAEKVKQHLSYRLGKTLVDGVKSPQSLFTIPKKSLSEIKEFFDNKKNKHEQQITLRNKQSNMDLVHDISNNAKNVEKSIILATVDFLPHIGGISIMTHELANNMVEQGWNVLVVAKVGSSIPDGFEQKYTLFVDADFKKGAKSGAEAVREDKRISVMFQRLIKKFNAKSILLLHPFYYGIGARDAATKAKINCSFYFHGFEIRSQLLGQYPKNLKNNVKDKKVHTLRERTFYSVATADHIFVNSSFTKSIFDGFSVKPKITVTGCGISTDILEKFQNIPTSVRRQNKQDFKQQIGESNNILLGFVGRLVTNKNVNSIIEMVRYNPKLKAIIVGTGPELSNLQELTHVAGVQDRVAFKGNVSEEEKWRILQSIDYVALLSKPDETTGHVEGFGIALLEGIVAGAVPISSGTGGMIDIIDDGENGLLCPIGEESSQAQRLVDYYNNQELFWSMQEKARQKLIDNFTWSLVSKRILDVISES